MFVLHFTEVLHVDILSEGDSASVTAFRMATYRAPPAPAAARLLDSLSTAAELQQEQEAAEAAAEAESTPLFKLAVGVAEASEGIACARTAGESPSAHARMISV